MASTMTKKWCSELCQWIGFLALFMVLTACGDIGGVGQCGGGGETGACLQIESIAPEDGDGNFVTSNVDVVVDICTDTSTSTPVVKLLFDHTAKVKISYNRLPGLGLNATDVPPVTLTKHAISYTVGSCPVGTCPSLSVLSPITQTIQIKVDSSIETELPFFPLQKKIEYITAGGSTNNFPSYIATYTLTGADLSGNPVKAEGSAEFTIGNYDKCVATTAG